MKREAVSLSLQSISKHFGSVKAVDGINLDIEQNEFFALLGPSGSGKTTLLRIIAGLERPSNGRVVVRGQDVSDLPPYRRHIGMVFQNFLLFPHKTVSENIVFPLRMQRIARPEREKRPRKELHRRHALDIQPTATRCDRAAAPTIRSLPELDPKR